MVKVKICGITNLDDAQAAVAAGCDALGFLFFKESRRYITPQRAKAIIDALPKKILKVGVFVNEQPRDIRWTAELCGFNMLQFHGDETPELCKEFSDYQIIKAVRIKRKRDFRNALRYNNNIFAFLFDTYTKSAVGGTGESFDWELIRDVHNTIDCPVFLAGGLTDKNVKEAIGIVRPDWVDVASSVELTPGKKDHKKIQKFIEVVKNTAL